MRALIYTRVSSDEQLKGLSLEVQERACRDFCARQGWVVEGVYREEGESAKTADRTQLKRLLADLRRRQTRIDFLVVYDTSRFARDVYVHATLKNLLLGQGVQLKAATQPLEDSAAGRAMENVLSAFNQFENEIRTEKVVAGMKEAVSRGRWLHRAPLGYRNDKQGGKKVVVPDPEPFALLRKGFELVADGAAPADVLRRLGALGLRARLGGPVRLQEWHRILRNPFYKGVVQTTEAGEVAGMHERLVTDETWSMVQAVLGGGARPELATRLKANPDFPLRGFVRCDHCGKPLTAALSRGKMGQRYGYYFCWVKGCRRVSVRAERLEGLFGELLEGVQLTEKMMRVLEATLRDMWCEAGQDGARERAAIRRRITELESRKKLLLEAYIYKQAIGRQDFEDQKSALDQEIGLANFELREAEVDALDLDGTMEYASALLTRTYKVWANATAGQKRRLQPLIFPDGARFDGETLRTPTIALPFRYLECGEGGEEGLVAHTGFEPVLPA